MNASHAKQPAASSPVLPPALSLPPPPIPTPPPPRRLFNPRLKLTHAYVADCVHVHACTWARSPFAFSCCAGRERRGGGRNVGGTGWGVTKVAGYFISVRRITCTALLSLSLFLSFAIYLSSSHRNMGRLYNACYEHLWRLHVSIA